MRDFGRMLAVGVLLPAMPAWVSDMSRLFVLLPLVYLWALVAGLIGQAVRKPLAQLAVFNAALPTG
ncbi:hypothetical protein [Corallococcus exercitus]|uniref:Uncharacterized protein n=1 Tax=Corallococcus exercitus TaxID=2316736 RepID=A0A7Y4JPE1_9BACT|nr:hypothetical protein [Corallococcus exercitus]NOK08448.1 hypothetical protein [Corallococcus exercitus]